MRRGSSKAEVIEYRGHRYRRYPNGSLTHRRYFSGSEPRSGFLHRHIWEDERGPIPSGCDIHHIDENTLNNSIENLECVTRREHAKRHPMVGARLERQREHMTTIREQANVWHASEAGKEEHRRIGALTWVDHTSFIKICMCCEKEFTTPFDRTKMCSSACRQRYRLRGPDRSVKCTRYRGGKCKCLLCH